MRTRIFCSSFYKNPLFAAFKASAPRLCGGRLTTILSSNQSPPSLPQQSHSFHATIMNQQSPSKSGNTISAPRAGAAVDMLPTYLADARAVEKYSPTTAPNGALQLSVAENQMLEDLLVPALTEFASSNTFPADAIYYQPTHGREGLRHAIAQYLQDLLELTDQSLDADGIVVGAGCNAVLENLCVSLAEPGQGVLIPTPYYAAFEFDLGSRAGLKVVPVQTMEHSSVELSPEGDSSSPIPPEAYYPTRAALDAAKQKSIGEQGIEPRILLLSHPQNPLGICYPPHVVKECIDWCRNNEIHLVSDEIYAGSVYKKDEADFTSALKLAADPRASSGLVLGPYIHLVYALSKDFALSGLRVGVLYSENPEIRLPLQKLNDLCCVSSHTQLLVERMMTEPGTKNGRWSFDFLDVNHERLRARCNAWQSCLEELDIPHLSATAGLFCWMDFSEFLPSKGSADEQERSGPKAFKDPATDPDVTAPAKKEHRERCILASATAFACLAFPHSYSC